VGHAHPAPGEDADLGAVTFHVSGEIDLDVHEEWDRALRRAVEQARACDADLHLDLARLSFIDTRGTSLLVEASRLVPAGRRMVLHHPPLPLFRVLEVLWPKGVPTIAIAEGTR
jgi:anti-anti-sigma factor